MAERTRMAMEWGAVVAAVSLVVTVIVTLIGQRIGDTNLRIGDLNLRIEQTNRLVDVNRQAIESNRRAIEANREAIEANREAIEANREAIEANGRRIDERFDALQVLISEALGTRPPARGLADPQPGRFSCSPRRIADRLPQADHPQICPGGPRRFAPSPCPRGQA